ncbi:hypothetical protein MRX96_049818 [Rhipicephalus microplus]
MAPIRCDLPTSHTLTQTHKYDKLTDATYGVVATPRRNARRCASIHYARREHRDIHFLVAADRIIAQATLGHERVLYDNTDDSCQIDSAGGGSYAEFRASSATFFFLSRMRTTLN